MSSFGPLVPETDIPPPNSDDGGESDDERTRRLIGGILAPRLTQVLQSDPRYAGELRSYTPPIFNRVVDYHAQKLRNIALGLKDLVEYPGKVYRGTPESEGGPSTDEMVA